MLAAFAALERRRPQPLVRPALLRERTLGVSSTVQLLIAAAFFGLVFTFTLYMQQVLGYSPLKAGFAYLPLAGGLMVGVGAAARLAPRIGVRPLMVGGPVLCAL